MLPFNQHDVRNPFQSALENPRSVIHKYIYILVPTRSTQLSTLPYHQSISPRGRSARTPCSTTYSLLYIYKKKEEKRKKSNLIPERKFFSRYSGSHPFSRVCTVPSNSTRDLGWQSGQSTSFHERGAKNLVVKSSNQESLFHHRLFCPNSLDRMRFGD